MRFVTVSSLRPQTETLQFEQLIATMSSKFAALHVNALADVLKQTLLDVCLALNVDRASLIEFGDEADILACHDAIRPARHAIEGASVPTDWTWVVDQLRDRSAAPLTRVIDLAGEARMSTLAVPITIDGACIGALVLGRIQPFRDWPPVVRDRARVVAEIIGSALRRSRQDIALQARVADNERLSRPTVEDVCLKDVKTFHDFGEIVGESAVMCAALDRLRQVAPLNCSVLLLGETGTGKELFAQALHDRSPRRSSPLVRVNCAALPPTLVETELFGHEKGAFTGAVGLRQGRFEIAHGGTILLDEIGDLPYDMQGKLLRVLQEGEFERVGSSRTRRVDVRVVAATHHDLERAVADGHFRADLFYRLGVFPIHVPPLRERREDVPSLAWFFIQQHQRALARHITKIPADVMSALQHHDWPGNVRELENVIERAMIRSIGDTLQLDEAPTDKPRQQRPVASGKLDDIQRSHIENTLRQCGWRINGTGNAAERLGLHPNTLRFRMKKLGILTPREYRLAGRDPNGRIPQPPHLPPESGVDGERSTRHERKPVRWEM